MKANKKFIEEKRAVSAVIGVILMVAITVAIAATVYVYVSGMIGASPETTPNVQLTQDKSAETLTVASAEPSDLEWGHLQRSFGSPYDTGTTTQYIQGWGTDTQPVHAGDILTFSVGASDLIFTIRHIATNTLVGSWTFPGT
jgi:flagellin-like protein